MRLTRAFDLVEIRIIGALMEKEQTTPDAYPLSLNSLLAACNQKSNRTPVMKLEIPELRLAIDRLRAEVLVWPVEGARVERFRHVADRKWGLDDASQAVMTVLLLRGAQTAGEIRTRCERLHPFRSSAEVEELLRSMASEEESLVIHLGRQPGQKEARWMHLVGGVPEISSTQLPAPKFEPPEKGLSQRVKELEERVAALEARIGESSESTSF